MADATKTIGLLFEAETGDAERRIAQIADALRGVGEVDLSKVDAVGASVGTVGDKATEAKPRLDQLSDGLKRTSSDASEADKELGVLGNSLVELARGLGVPKDKLDDVAAAIRGFGVGPSSAVVLATATVAAYGLAAFDAGRQSFDFQRAIENLTGSASSARSEWEFVLRVTRDLETNLGITAARYRNFLSDLQGTALPSAVARDAFIGIVGALDSIGRDSEAEKVLKAFARAAADGNISTRDLDTAIRAIPGGLELFASVLGVSRDRLYELAKGGELGTNQIAAFASALAAFERVSLTPVASAFRDLMNELKEGALLMGADSAYMVALTVIEKSLRAVTVGVATFNATMGLLGETIANVAFTISTGDWSGFVDRLRESWDRAAERVDYVARKLVGSPQSMKESADAAGQAGEEAGKRIAAAFERAGDAVNAALGSMKSDAERVNATLKELGIDDAKLIDPIDRVKAALGSLFEDPAARGDQLFAGLVAGLAKIPPDAALAAEALALVDDAIKRGAMSAEEGAAARGEIELWASGLAKKLDEATSPALYRNKEAIDRQAKATQEAQRAAQDFEAKMEQIASNERIKLIEASVKLNIAQIEADAKVAVAAFESISRTVESTGETLVGLFDVLGRGTRDWASWRLLTEEIERESERRDESLRTQNELIRAQIDLTRARIEAMQQGEGIIKIDGAGLQPHLEAFMWEIVRAIQVRVNQDGFGMLLGLPA